MTREPDRRTRRLIDRQLGWLIALGGCIVILDQTIFRISEFDEWSVWWNAGSLVVVAGIVLLAVGGLVLPQRVLGAAWWILPILFVALQATWMYGYRGEDPDAAIPWLWTVEPPIITMLLLVLRPVAAVAASLVISSTPALASLIVLGAIPQAVLRETPNQLGNVLYVVIFIGVHLQLERLRIVEGEARAQERRRIRTAVRAEQHTRLARVVHDEVLSVLSTAMHTDGPPPAVLRAAAGRAMSALGGAARADPAGVALIPAEEAVGIIAGNLRLIDDAVTLETCVFEGPIRRDVAEATALAAGEALRNSVRHAGGRASRHVRLTVSSERVRVTVEDDGIGFVPGTVHHGMGIPDSMERRMSELGGSVLLRSRPGHGTKVALTWPT